MEVEGGHVGTVAEKGTACGSLSVDKRPLGEQELSLPGPGAFILPLCQM